MPAVGGVSSHSMREDKTAWPDHAGHQEAVRSKKPPGAPKSNVKKCVFAVFMSKVKDPQYCWSQKPRSGSLRYVNHQQMAVEMEAVVLFNFSRARDGYRSRRAPNTRMTARYEWMSNGKTRPDL